MNKSALQAQDTKESLKAVIKLKNCLEDPLANTWQSALSDLELACKSLPEPPISALMNKIHHLLNPFIENMGLEKIPNEIINDCYIYIQKLEEVIAMHVMDPMLTTHHVAQSKPVLLIGLQDKQLTEEIIHQVVYFGYPSLACHSLHEIIQKVDAASAMYSAIILDTEYCKKEDLQTLKELSERVPIIFISHHHDVATRLFAVQAGGRGYLVSPLEFTNLIEKIDQITTPTSERSTYRILVVEDSRTQAKVIRQHLEHAGMISEILLNPLKINDVLIEFQPDLILLDLYMPQCSGVDLAKVIRQQDMFVGIPIVYLSAEEDVSMQLTAIRDGGDDFLTKPIVPQYMIDAIAARAARSRTLRAEMIMDSLTETLNHTRILEQLELEIARAKRNKTPLSFAM
ncbi:MAG TPA: response regulator, partial [Candidatus Berkiella sp.]|nr:response regulator [Candidatus Berkiella sp.]